jgi:hypothetical protein
MREYPAGGFGDLMQALGGPAALGAILGVSDAAVYNMASTNKIPQRHHARLLQLAVARNHSWRPPAWDHRIQLRMDPRAMRDVFDPAALQAADEDAA